TLLSTVQFVRFLPDAMEHNLDNLTNELHRGNQIARDNERAQQSLGMSIEGAIALLPSPAAADQFCEIIRRRQAEPAWAGLIQGCETISSIVPKEQEQKLAVIRDIQRRISDSVLDNVPPELSPRLREVRADLAAQRMVSATDAPASLVDRFREQDGT